MSKKLGLCNYASGTSMSAVLTPSIGLCLLTRDGITLKLPTLLTAPLIIVLLINPTEGEATNARARLQFKTTQSCEPISLYTYT